MNTFIIYRKFNVKHSLPISKNINVLKNICFTYLLNLKLLKQYFFFPKHNTFWNRYSYLKVQKQRTPSSYYITIYYRIVNPNKHYLYAVEPVSKYYHKHYKKSLLCFDREKNICEKFLKAHKTKLSYFDNIIIYRRPVSAITRSKKSS